MIRSPRGKEKISAESTIMHGHYLEILRNSEFLGTHVYSAAWFVDLEIEQDN